ncbi:acyl carrier protein [Amycolatopsis silviterrae]|uniref:Acyl carrier protein n=1 Tax=Amycolatopsis silviterrae TaxID=1656914 RepID=A0ABW5HFY6_9PSEU
MAEFTLDSLKSLLREVAGEEEGIDLDSEIATATFEQLGYDSLALLETSARIKHDYGVVLADDDVTSVGSPAELVDLVNKGLNVTAG